MYNPGTAGGALAVTAGTTAFGWQLAVAVAVLIVGFVLTRATVLRRKKATAE